MSYLKIAAAVSLVAALGLGGQQAAVLKGGSDELTQAQAQSEKQSSALATEKAKAEELQASAAELEATIATRQGVVAERDRFAASLAAFQAALTSATGKADGAAQKDRVLAAQTAVTGILDDAPAVAAQVAEVDAATSELTAAVKAKDEAVAAEQRRIQAAQRPAASPRVSGSSSSRGSSPAAASSAPAPAASGGDWFADMRSRLNSVGGGHIALVAFDGNCGGVQSVACADPNGTIFVSPAIASQSSARKNTIMAHELAHQYQFPIMGKIRTSAGYAQLFGGNIEQLANCMASAKGYTAHGHSCSAAQISWAGAIWSGTVAS